MWNKHEHLINILMNTQTTYWKVNKCYSAGPLQCTPVVINRDKRIRESETRKQPGFFHSLNRSGERTHSLKPMEFSKPAAFAMHFIQIALFGIRFFFDLYVFVSPTFSTGLVPDPIPKAKKITAQSHLSPKFVTWRKCLISVNKMYEESHRNE